MGATTSTDANGQRPNSSEMVGAIGPGLFWLLLTGSFMLVICLVVNLNVIKLKIGAKAGLNLLAAMMFGLPFLFFVGSRKEPRVNAYIVEDLEFTYTNYWLRISYHLLYKILLQYCCLFLILRYKIFCLQQIL